MSDVTGTGGSDQFASVLKEPRQLVLDLDGFEGPIDLLLSLARDQKVDLTRISVLELGRPVPRLY